MHCAQMHSTVIQTHPTPSSLLLLHTASLLTTPCAVMPSLKTTLVVAARHAVAQFSIQKQAHNHHHCLAAVLKCHHTTSASTARWQAHDMRAIHKQQRPGDRHLNPRPIYVATVVLCCQDLDVLAHQARLAPPKPWARPELPRPVDKSKDSCKKEKKIPTASRP